MSRYDDLRRMREAKFEAEERRYNETQKRRADSVTINAPAVQPPPPISVTPKRGRGRPKTGNAMSDAERARRY